MLLLFVWVVFVVVVAVVVDVFVALVHTFAVARSIVPSCHNNQISTMMMTKRMMLLLLTMMKHPWEEDRIDRDRHWFHPKRSANRLFPFHNTSLTS